MWNRKAISGPDGLFNEKDHTVDAEKGFDIRMGEHTASLKEGNPWMRRCSHEDCNAKLLPGETEAFCCANGRIKTDGKYWQMKPRSKVDSDIHSR